MTESNLQERMGPGFEAFVEAAPDAIVVVDESGLIVALNSLAERMFGYSRKDLLGQRIEVLVPEKFRARHVEDRRLYAGDPHTRPMGAGTHLSARTREGEELPVEISLSPLRTSQGLLVMSSIRDITQRRKAEDRIRASLREKEALLREIHHRVKNNLQVTSSLLSLQSDVIPDEKTRAMFSQTQDRIRSMALVHEKLYQSTNLAEIDFSEYLRSLADLLFKSSAIDPETIRLEITGSGVFLSIDTAVPCGLIANELLSNALKHAFTKSGGGTIRVHVERDGPARSRIEISDDGSGLAPTAEAGEAATLGLRLVQGLVRQIDGTIEIDRTAGTSFTIRFPDQRGGRSSDG